MVDAILFGCDGCCEKGKCEEEVEDNVVGQSSRESCSGDPDCQCDNCKSEDDE